MIGFLAMLTVPPPPPPPERTTPLPGYSAECLISGADGRGLSISLSVDGVGESRRIKIGSAELPQLVVADQRAFTLSTGDPKRRWSTADVAEATLANRRVKIWMEVEPDLSHGAAIRIEDQSRQLGIPLFAGMCRANPMQVSISQ